MFEFFKTYTKKKEEALVIAQSRKTVLKMLKEILRLTKMNDPKDAEDFWTYHDGKHIRFTTNKASGKKLYPLLTLTRDDQYVIDGKFMWRCSVKEYNEVYNTHFNWFIQDKLMAVYALLQNDRKKLYASEQNKYELTILQALNVLTESKKTNGGILPSAHQDRIKLLLSSFVDAVRMKEQMLIDLENQMRQATNDSLTHQLDNEIAFVEKYITNEQLSSQPRTLSLIEFEKEEQQITNDSHFYQLDDEIVFLNNYMVNEDKEKIYN